MKPRLPILVLALCAAAFLLGLVQLFKLRFEVGDVYPAYSSLRSDPLGTMAFYESLGQMPGLSVRRDFSAENRLPEGKDTTYLHLAAHREDWTSMPEEVVSEIEGFVARGGRLAVTFYPETTHPFRFLSGKPASSPTPPPGAKGSPPPTNKKKSKRYQQEQERLLRRTSLAKRWGLEFGLVLLKPGSDDTYEPAQAINQTDLSLPESLAWHSAMVFTNLNSSWETIYARGTNAVLIERKFGAGSVLMATDSYFLSNEALRQDRHADLLAWMVGPSRHIFFDEAHLGILESSGVATLMRKYRLHGLALGLLLLAGLFIWKNSLSLVPPCPDPEPAETVTGKDAAAGFVNLLRRNIAPRDLLNVCFAEWTKSLTHGNPQVIARVDQAQAILEAENARPQRERNPLQAYQEICRVLKRPQ